MNRYTYKRPSSLRKTRQQLPLWIIAVGGFLSLLIVIGMPDDPAGEGPPPGVETYRDGDLLCWDKVVCCKPADPSTCATIPICEMVK